MGRTVDGALYVPNPDDQEMRDTALGLQNMLLLVTGKPDVFYGTKKTLGDLPATQRLYVMGHGDVAGQLVLKTGNPNRWTAAQLANQLEDDGLNRKVESLELLVCNAAKFAAPDTKLARLAKIESKAATVRGQRSVDDAKKDPEFVALSTRFDKKEEKYEGARKRWKGELRAGMVEPFAYGLKQALINLGFSRELKVYAYNFSVAKYFKNGAIHIHAPDRREATDSDIVEF